MFNFGKDYFGNDYSDKRITIDENVIHFHEYGSTILLFIYILLILGVSYILIDLVFPSPTPDDDTEKIILILFFLFVTRLMTGPIDMFFIKDTYIDFANRKILTINVFEKRKKYTINNIDDVVFDYQLYFQGRSFYYRIVLSTITNKKPKIVILGRYRHKKDAKSLCDFLNNFN